MKYQAILLIAFSCILYTGCDGKPSNVCTPGSTFRRQCNECTCNQDGTDMICTKRVCADSAEERAEEAENAAEASALTAEATKTEENKEEVKVEETKVEETKVEEKIEEKKSEDEATETKTSVAKEEKLPEPELKPAPEALDTCTPGEIYKNECNHCTCPPSGVKSESFCTLLACGIHSHHH